MITPMAVGIGRRKFVSTLALAGVARANAESDWRREVAHWEKRIPELMAEYKVPGLSIAVIRNARVAWRRGFGVKDVTTKAPVTNDTMFEAASMSKPPFAYMVMKLCERGVLGLDTPLTRYTPEKFVEGDARLDLITPRRVLSHTTGFPNWRSTEEQMQIRFTPGEQFGYSGEGYDYLQSVVTRLLGRTDSSMCQTFFDGYRVCATDFEEFMGKRVLSPFGMASSGYVWKEAFARRMARPHDKDGKPQELHKSTAVTVARYGSAGALLSTPTDYAKFLIEVIDPKPADAYRLNGASLKEMMRPQIEVPIPAEYGFRASWALGWEVLHLKDGDSVGHGGDNEGFHSMSQISLARKSGYVVMTNGENGYEMIAKRLQFDLIASFL
jgi:CubicO group peptidase (beta-lactamase class C family)